MPFLILDKETDLEALASSLARTPRAAAAVRERLVALNPQLADAKRIPKGGVLILPAGNDIKAGAGTKISGANLAEFAETFGAGTRAAASRAAERLESLTAERTAVRDALKPAAAKRLVESDPQLQKQLAAAEAQFKAEQKRAGDSRAKLAAAIKAAQAELARVQRIASLD
jgi:hypothetical protein